MLLLVLLEDEVDSRRWSRLIPLDNHLAYSTIVESNEFWMNLADLQEIIGGSDQT